MEPKVKLQDPAPKKAHEYLAETLADDMGAVNDLILKEMQSDVALIPQLAGYLIASGGKRIRPLLTLSSAALFGYHGIRAQRLAACVEFIHTATLLHDDVVDESAKRRGKDSANLVFGNQASVLVGDFLFSRAFQLMVADGALPVLKLLSDASAIIAEGEVMQLSTTSNLETSFEEYCAVIEAKTAALFSAATEVGGLIIGVPETVQNDLHEYGMALGVAFQIIDDILDYSRANAALGKKVGDDFKEGKMTLPVMLCLEKADDAEKAFWVKTLKHLDQDDDDFDKACALIEKYDALRGAHKVAADYAKRAEQAIERIMQSGAVKNPEIAQALTQLCAESLKRNF